MKGSIDKTLIIFLPLLLSVWFIVTRNIMTVFLFELMMVFQTLYFHDSYIRKRAFIASCLFFNIYFLGAAIKALFIETFDKVFYYVAMFVVAGFLSSIMILSTLALEMIIEKSFYFIRNKEDS